MLRLQILCNVKIVVDLVRLGVITGVALVVLSIYVFTAEESLIQVLHVLQDILWNGIQHHIQVQMELLSVNNACRYRMQVMEDGVVKAACLIYVIHVKQVVQFLLLQHLNQFPLNLILHSLLLHNLLILNNNIPYLRDSLFLKHTPQLNNIQRHKCIQVPNQSIQLYDLSSKFTLHNPRVI